MQKRRQMFPRCFVACCVLISILLSSHQITVFGSEILEAPYQYPSDTTAAIEPIETFVLCDCKAAPALAVKPKEIPIALKAPETLSPEKVREEPITLKNEDATATLKGKGEEPPSIEGGASESNLEPAIVLFKFNENKITPDREEEILRIADRIKKSGGEVKVFGHTCDLGDKDQNDQISLERAEGVAAILKEQGVVVASVIGMGSCCPRSSDRRLNRRVEIRVMREGGDHEE